MHAKRSHIAIIAAVATALTGLRAHATDYTYDGGGSGAWTDPLAWNLNSGYPNSTSDSATIGSFDVPAFSNVTLTVNRLVMQSSSSKVHIGSGAVLRVNGSVGTMSIASGALADVRAGGTLELLKASSEHTVAGTIQLSGADAKLYIGAYLILKPGLFGAYGRVRGQDESATIEIANGADLVNLINIMGKLVVQAQSGWAILENVRDSSTATGGNVVADAGGILKLETNVALADTEYFSQSVHNRPRYEVSGEGSILSFNRASDWSDGNHPRLKGDFLVKGQCAMLQVMQTVETSGSLTLSCGVVNAPGTAVFTYNWVSTFSYDTIYACLAAGPCSCP